MDYVFYSHFSCYFPHLQFVTHILNVIAAMGRDKPNALIVAEEVTNKVKKAWDEINNSKDFMDNELWHNHLIPKIKTVQAYLIREFDAQF